MKAAKEQGREPTLEELKEAFKKAKEEGAIVGGEWFEEQEKDKKHIVNFRQSVYPGSSPPLKFSGRHYGARRRINELREIRFDFSFLDMIK